MARYKLHLSKKIMGWNDFMQNNSKVLLLIYVNLGIALNWV